MKRSYFYVYILLISFTIACVEKEDSKPTLNSSEALDLSKIKGTGMISFNGYLPLANKPIPVYYHIPSQANVNTPILVVFHGNDRSGEYARNGFIANANLKNFILIAPEFSQAQFPGGDAYNLGNVFVDGDNPTPTTLNDKSIWTFSAVEPIFEFIKSTIKSKALVYDVFGHSAGGQFAQRLILFKPTNKINNLVISAPGWYTTLDKTLDFPYGTKSCPAVTYTYDYQFEKYFSIIVGESDTDPNDSDLRHNDIVDKQGLNRYSRAQYFYSQSRDFALKDQYTFNWKFQILQNVGHDFNAAANAAALILYP